MRTAGVGVCASTVLSVCHDMTKSARTRAIGIAVQMISSRLLPWICGGSSSSPFLRL